MNEGFRAEMPAGGARVWQVGALVRAIADTLQARFNPAAVRGEISGFSRAASGHCYFSLKDAQGQIRCAMFRRAAQGVDFNPAEGDLVEVSGRLDVYGPRGDLQLIVESLRRAGQGALFEQFLRLKAQLEAEGCFDEAHKRPLPPLPASIAVVTSLGAAALRDVATALARRVPHLPVALFPAAVQGAQAPAELCAALEAAYRQHAATGQPAVLLLVRGGGSLEDLWAFNDPAVVRAVARAPMPVVCGVGHETDFTLCDFAADLRAPTPTAAAELCAPARADLLAVLDLLEGRLQRAAHDGLDLRAQQLDRLGQRLGRPSGRLTQSQRQLQLLQGRLERLVHLGAERQRQSLQRLSERLPLGVGRQLVASRQRLDHVGQSLALLDPALVLQRGYAWLTDDAGQAITRVAQAAPGQAVRAVLADGELDLTVERLTTGH
ncbi:MAG: exodeoxyribonuclease VII large subunit [Thiobacillus sp.]|uniref:exodeoxyribonuclease VII large subunit n=1 Tax=Thiobacillus sp. TaxID=924 RepID=UPI00273726E0|nr:exodeoxyribonuclease VII large subunit [Thiobacillus sp.]MDP3584221.1 exodeoxyribonuclease VII large subunit [Thiobacillus sp.]